MSTNTQCGSPQLNRWGKNKWARARVFGKLVKQNEQKKNTYIELNSEKSNNNNGNDGGDGDGDKTLW